MAFDTCSRGTNHVIEQDEDDQAPRGLRIGPLMTSGDVKREAGRLYRSARRGELSSADASRLASVLALSHVSSKGLRSRRGSWRWRRRRQVVRRDLIRRLEALEAPLAGPSVVEIEEYAAFVLMLHRRFKGYPRPEGEEAAMQLLEAATTFEQRAAAVEAYEEACKLRPYLGKDPAEVLSARHKPLRYNNEVA
jgi:hypothetical protein